MSRTAEQKIALMHNAYGVMSGVKCKTCLHLDAYCNGDCTRVWYKCHMYGVSNGEATDWRCGNTACGAFKISVEEARKKHLYGEIFRLNKGLKKPIVQEEIEGQITMTETLA